jgi:hypothetical protein
MQKKEERTKLLIQGTSSPTAFWRVMQKKEERTKLLIQGTSSPTATNLRIES